MIINIIHNIIIYGFPLHHHPRPFLKHRVISLQAKKKTNARVLGTNTLAVPPHTHII